jgi:hypothetical protein
MEGRQRRHSDIEKAATDHRIDLGEQTRKGTSKPKIAQRPPVVFEPRLLHTQPKIILEGLEGAG